MMAKLLNHLILLSLINLYVNLQSVLTAGETLENAVQMRAGAAFKIALFADLHFGESAWTDWGPLQDVNPARVMSKVLDDESSDFVIYLGDVITANNKDIANASLYWDQAISPTRARGKPWASLFGNHDDAPFEWPLEWFSAPGIPQIRYPVEITFIISSFDPKLAVASLYFLHSGGGSYPQVISRAQVEWFRYKAQELNPDTGVPEIVFWHIPRKAYEKVAPKSAVERSCVCSINKCCCSRS